MSQPQRIVLRRGQVEPASINLPRARQANSVEIGETAPEEGLLQRLHNTTAMLENLRSELDGLGVDLVAVSAPVPGDEIKTGALTNMASMPESLAMCGRLSDQVESLINLVVDMRARLRI